MGSAAFTARAVSAVLVSAALIFTSTGSVFAQSVLPRLENVSSRKLGPTPADSGPPEWPQGLSAPAGAPNVLVILTDDVGFGSSSTFGGPVPTPTLDDLAARGLRYNQFNTTALCSPTRAALLTGRGPHSVAMGNVNNLPTGYDGYTSVIPKTAGMIAEILRQNGYNTSAFGKWHLTPEWEQSEAGPFDRWPAGQGFEYFYGFHGGDTDQFAPALFENTLAKKPPTDQPGYILDHDLADQAIRWIQHQHDLAPNKPFFAYYATGSAHSPHSAPKEWLEKFRGKFDQGWDTVRQDIFARQKKLGIIPADTKLTPRPDFLPAWSSLSPDRKRVYARMAEAYAAALAYSDDQIGRIIASLRESGQLDNTLIIFIEGDNGSSAEGGRQGLFAEENMISGQGEENFADIIKHIDEIGGPKAHNHYPAAWAWALNAPFQYYKQVASHFGGIRNGMVVSWPAHIKDVGGLRSQFLHVSDVTPTILEAIGVRAPAVLNGAPQSPMTGVSFYNTFDGSKDPSRRHTLALEMMQNLAIYSDGWWAGTRPAAAPWDITRVRKIELANRQWELYHVAEDFSQSRDLAMTYPEKLAELKKLFFAEAAREKILPVHSIGDGAEGRPSLASGRTKFVYHAGLTRVPENTAPRVLGRSYEISADVVIGNGPTNGVLITQGGLFGGYGFYVKDGIPTFCYNAIDERYTVRSAERLTPGKHTVTAAFAADSATPGAGGQLTITVDGKQVGAGRIARTHVAWISNSEGLDVGEDTLTPINDDYTIETSTFTGQLKQVVVTLK